MTNSKIMNNNSRKQDTHKLVLKLNFVGNIVYQADKCAYMCILPMLQQLTKTEV